MADNKSIMENIFAMTVTIIHLLLCLVMSYGVLFSQTPIHAFSVLCCLVTLFLMIRFFKSCILTPLEESDYFLKTSRIGRALLVKDFTKMPLTDFEEISVGSLMLLQIIRTVTILTVSPKRLF